MQHCCQHTEERTGTCVSGARRALSSALGAHAGSDPTSRITTRDAPNSLTGHDFRRRPRACEQGTTTRPCFAAHRSTEIVLQLTFAVWSSRDCLQRSLAFLCLPCKPLAPLSVQHVLGVRSGRHLAGWPLSQLLWQLACSTAECMHACRPHWQSIYMVCGLLRRSCACLTPRNCPKS